MKKTCFVFAFLLICFFVSAQDIDYARAIVEKLASPELQGRGYAGNGNFLAAEFISSEYKRLGLLPFGNAYYQKFTLAVNTFPGNLTLKINHETMRPGIDYLVDPSSSGINGSFNLLKIKRQDIDTHEKLIAVIRKAASNFILIDDTEKESEDREFNKITDENISVLKYNPKIPIKGVIEFTHHKLTWDIATFQNCRPVIVVNKPMSIANIETIDLTIENKFLKSCETQNVIGYIQGSLKPDSFVVVLAHYDHLGLMGKETYFPGANDNASGMAMLLNLAAHYVKNPTTCTMVFIALSAEEPGLLGAKAFTEHPLIKLQKIKFLINFDLAGTGEEGIRVVNGSIFAKNFELLKQLNAEYHLLPKIDIRGEACNSDHCMFYQKGVPCFYIYTQGGIKAYHDVYDRFETLPFTEFVNYSALMIKFFDRL